MHYAHRTRQIGPYEIKVLTLSMSVYFCVAMGRDLSWARHQRESMGIACSMIYEHGYVMTRGSVRSRGPLLQYKGL